MPSVQTVKEERKLNGRDNYAQWVREIRVVLGSAGLVPHITKDASVIRALVEARYPVSSPATAAETSKRAVALYEHEKEQSTALSTLYGSLTETVQNKLPSNLIDFENPQPKGLYDHLVTTYGADNGSRLAELWSSIFGETIPENEDPEPHLTAIRSQLAEITSSDAEDGREEKTREERTDGRTESSRADAWTVPSSTMHPSPRQPLCQAASPPISPNPALPATPAPFAPPACSVDPPLSNAKSETSTTTTAPSAPSRRRVAKRTHPRTQASASASASASAMMASHAHGIDEFARTNVSIPTPTQAAASRTPTPTPTAAATPTAARPSTPDFGPFASVLRQINTDLHVFEAKRQQDGFDAYFGLNSGAGAGESPLAARGAVQIGSANDDTPFGGARGDPRGLARSNSATAPANLHRWQLGELAARLELGNVDDCDSLADLTRSIIILPDTNDNELEYAPLAPLSRSLAYSADDEREPDDENKDHSDANTERGEDELISLPSGQGEYEHASHRDSGRHKGYDHANELGLGLDALSGGIISPTTGDYDDYHDDDQDRDLVHHLVIESQYTPALDDRISHHGGGQEADESFSSYAKADNDMDQDSEAEVRDEAGDGWRGNRSISLPLVDENQARAQINEIMQRDRNRLHHGQSLDHSIGVEREQTGVGVGVGIGIGSMPRESHVLCGSGLPSSLRRLSVKHHDIHHHFYHHHHHHHHHYRHEHKHQQGPNERERARALEQGDGSAHARVDKNEYEHELLAPAIHRAECSGEGEEKLETTSIESVTAPARVPPPSHSMDKVDGRDEEDDKSEKATPFAPSPTRVADQPLVPVVVVTPFVSVAVASPSADPFQPLSGTSDTATPDPSANVALSAGDAADISISTYAEEGDRSSHSLGGRRREALSDASEQLYVIKFRPPNIRPITPEPQSELDKILADRRRVSGATSASSARREA